MRTKSILRACGIPTVNIVRLFFYKRIFPFVLFTLLPLCGFSQSLDERIASHGLTDLRDLDSTILIDMKYATTDNFMAKNVYGELHGAYLLDKVAKAVVAANKELAKLKPGHRIVIFDAARPISVQRYMWSLVKDTPDKIYVASPTRGGMHNFGAAVDLTIAGPDGRYLDMGTPYDHFGPEAHVGGEQALAEKGSISMEAMENRRFLVALMKRQGMRVYSKEWWHYELFSTQYVRENFRLLDF